MSRITIVGGGPAGLIAAERLSAQGHAVSLHEKMPSLGRRLLMAGRGGLNLTHSEPFETFLSRYGPRSAVLRPYLEAFPPQALIDWAEELGQATFVGSSGRVFPKAMKASPLLRAWLGRLSAQGVQFHLRSVWTGWSQTGALQFLQPDGVAEEVADAVIIAAGGASWPRLGADGAAAGLLSARGVETSPYVPANVGATVNWSDTFKDRFAGQPIKGAAYMLGKQIQRGEALITRYGLEGGAIYARGPHLRALMATRGQAQMLIDLRPDLPGSELIARLHAQPERQSLANRLRKGLNFSPMEINLLREAHGPDMGKSPLELAAAIKAIPLTLTGLRGLERAISSAGGVTFSSLDDGLMLKDLPGMFCAGEMLDWEAPTGGYLLQACFATGVAAAHSASAWLENGRKLP